MFDASETLLDNPWCSCSSYFCTVSSSRGASVDRSLDRMQMPGYLSLNISTPIPILKPHKADTHTSSMPLNPASTPRNHLPLSSNSSPTPPPFALRLLASLASSTARIFLAFRMLTSSCIAVTCTCLCGSAACSASICRSKSANWSSRSLRRVRVACSGRVRAGLSDLGPWDWRRSAMVASRLAISSGRDSSCDVWNRMLS